MRYIAHPGFEEIASNMTILTRFAPFPVGRLSPVSLAAASLLYFSSIDSVSWTTTVFGHGKLTSMTSIETPGLRSQTYFTVCCTAPYVVESVAHFSDM